MIKQCAVTNIKSRTECNSHDSTGFLPLIVAPMYSCVDKHNAHIFLENKIKVCMPRKEYMDETYIHCSNENYFDSYSLQEFIELFIESEQGFLNDSNFNKVKTSICIDTAAGHLKKLHDAIREAKKIHGDNLIIMAGNVSSVKAFVELAKTGVDYIRVGIGGGGGCNTTSNTGVGQENLENLIKNCKRKVYGSISNLQYFKEEGYNFYIRHGFISEYVEINSWDLALAKVKIVADGISSYINYCQKEYGFNDNGYAAINKLLFAGADLVMVGKLFAQCVESAGEKGVQGLYGIKSFDKWKEQNMNYPGGPSTFEEYYKRTQGKSVISAVVKYSGMSTQEEQKKYKKPYRTSGGIAMMDFKTGDVETIKTPDIDHYHLNPSEGSIQWIPVRWSLNDWLFGSENQDQYPYLMGWVHSIKSAMAYTGKTNL